MLRIFTGTIAILCAFVAFGQTQADTIKVYFEVNRDKYNPDLFDNASVMEPFIEKVDSANSAGAIERIDVFGYSSPEGSHQRNQRLSDRRCRTIADYIITRTGVDPSKVNARGMGEAWDELRAMVEANSDVPYREKILDIIDNTPEWIFDSNGRIIGGRKKRLMDLAGGRPYRWLLANIFPKLRYALTISVSYVTIEEPVPEPEDVIEPIDTIIIDEPIIDEPIVVDTVAVADTVPTITFDAYKPLYRLAVKTNFVTDAILMPNLEVEWLMNDRWSVAVEGNLAWWGKYAKERSYRMCIISPEVRRWINPRAPWHGMYVGAFAGCGWYDLEKGTPGYRGEGVMGGLSFGYMWPISSRLSFEAAVGAGYMYTRYKEYRPMQGHHVYQRTKELNYFGPLKVKFSLAWRFWDANKRKISQTAVQYE